jgi:hypothetical protein
MDDGGIMIPIDTTDEQRKRAVWLDVSSWRGISIGAIHFYGELKTTYHDDLPHVELKRKLTKSEAKELTKLQNDNSLFQAGFRWEAGDETRCFDTKEDVIKAAIAQYQALFPTKTLLLLGSPVYAEHDAVLHDANAKNS